MMDDSSAAQSSRSIEEELKVWVFSTALKRLRAMTCPDVEEVAATLPKRAREGTTLDAAPPNEQPASLLPSAGTILEGLQPAPSSTDAQPLKPTTVPTPLAVDDQKNSIGDYIRSLVDRAMGTNLEVLPVNDVRFLAYFALGGEIAKAYKSKQKLMNQIWGKYFESNPVADRPARKRIELFSVTAVADFLRKKRVVKRPREQHSSTTPTGISNGEADALEGETSGDVGNDELLCVEPQREILHVKAKVAGDDGVSSRLTTAPSPVSLAAKAASLLSVFGVLSVSALLDKLHAVGYTEATMEELGSVLAAFAQKDFVMMEHGVVYVIA